MLVDVSFQGRTQPVADLRAALDDEIDARERNPRAPRLIALDEAFAGVDDDSRAKGLGLLATFDLDVMMTSEREWGCYPQVPGLAIAQLARQDGIDAVLVTPWRWDGSVRVPMPRPEPYVPEPVAAAPTAQPDLFSSCPQ
jgi:putative exonuclease SbcCD C subunit